MALRWLRYEKRCVIVLRERTPRWIAGHPDVIGLLPSRHLVEIEIKRSVSDFRADKNKPCRRSREFYMSKNPKQFYYLMPKEIAEKVKPEIPEWAGLMTNEHERGGIVVLKGAPINKLATRLSPIECCRMLPMLVNAWISSESSRDSNRWNFIDGHEPYIPRGVIDFQI